MDMETAIVLGAGVCGLATAIMLARDGHAVTVLERDGDPVPPDAEAAWEGWQRGGVVQFRQAHYLQARGREVLDEELPPTCGVLSRPPARCGSIPWGGCPSRSPTGRRARVTSGSSAGRGGVQPSSR
jgi:2-polyprenyl-6-methoxyphenol hydroxylase-like FAD-dependent oxidoreductase